LPPLLSGGAGEAEKKLKTEQNKRETEQNKRKTEQNKRERADKQA